MLMVIGSSTCQGLVVAEQQTPLALRLSRHVHVGRLRGLSVSLLVEGLPGHLRFIEVTVGRLAANTLTWVERDKERDVTKADLLDSKVYIYISICISIYI